MDTHMEMCRYCLKSTWGLKELSKLDPFTLLEIPHPGGDGVTPLTSIKASAMASKEQVSAPDCTWRSVHLFLRGTETGLFILLFPPLWSIQAACLSKAQLIPNNHWSRRTHRVFYRAPLPNSLSLSSEECLLLWVTKSQRERRAKLVTRGELKMMEEIPVGWNPSTIKRLYAADFWLEAGKRQVSPWACATWLNESEHLRGE